MRLHKLIYLPIILALLLTGLSGCTEIETIPNGATTTTEAPVEEAPVEEEGEVTESSDTASMALVLLDCNNIDAAISISQMPTQCAKQDSFSFSRPGTLHLTLLDTAGAPIQGKRITFATDVGTILGDNPKRQTDKNGMASIILLLSTQDSGAGKVTVTAEGEGVEGFTTSTFFSVGNTSLSMKISSDLPANTNLADGSSTILKVEITDTTGEKIDTPFVVNFTSQCVTDGKANLDTEVTGSNGEAQTTYESKGCSGEDTIIATANLGSLSENITLNIDSLPAHALEFVSASPEMIFIKGSGGGPESSILTFKVLDQLSRPIAQQPVNFTLVSNMPGVELLVDFTKSNSAGEVQTTVVSGNTGAVVQVKASFQHPVHADTLITTHSRNLTVSTGFPDNDGFSIALDKYNPEAWGYNGEKVSVTAMLNDHYNNPVPDGTAINFETEGGTIDASCITVNGECSAAWRSSEPRIIDGRLTLLIYTVGEEKFSDHKPSDGLYDKTDGWDVTLSHTAKNTANDIAEAFRDDNENGVFDADVEEYKDFNYSGTRDPANGIFNGTLCSDAALGANDCSKETLHLYRNITMVMSTSSVNIELLQKIDGVYLPIIEPVIVPQFAKLPVRAIYSDLNGNSPAGGSEVLIYRTGSSSTIDGTTSFTDANRSFSIETNATEPTVQDFNIQNPGYNTNSLESLLFKLTSPKGTETIRGLNLCSSDEIEVYLYNASGINVSDTSRLDVSASPNTYTAAVSYKGCNAVPAGSKVEIKVGNAVITGDTTKTTEYADLQAPVNMTFTLTADATPTPNPDASQILEIRLTTPYGYVFESIVYPVID